VKQQYLVEVHMSKQIEDIIAEAIFESLAGGEFDQGETSAGLFHLTLAHHIIKKLNQHEFTITPRESFW
jgi:hypothetical protein